MSGTEYDPRDHPAFGVVDGEVFTSLRTAGWHLVGSTDLDADDLAWMHRSRVCADTSVSWRRRSSTWCRTRRSPSRPCAW